MITWLKNLIDHLIAKVLIREDDLHFLICGCRGGALPWLS